MQTSPTISVNEHSLHASLLLCETVALIRSMIALVYPNILSFSGQMVWLYDQRQKCCNFGHFWAPIALKRGPESKFWSNSFWTW